MKSTFLPSKGLLCLYDKQNNTWLLVDMEFLRVQLNISLVCCAHAWAIELTLEEKFQIYARPCIILYISPITLQKKVVLFIYNLTDV